MDETPKQGRYEPVAELGRGGAARVWAGKLPGIKKPFAFKYLREELIGDRLYRQRFAREAEIGLAVSGEHPNIVTVRGYDPDAAGAPLLVLDLVGPPLAALKEQLVGDWCAIRWIAVEALRALVHIERFRVVHRDVSPGNLLVAPNGRVRLNDFGNATRYDGAASPRIVGGTIPYVSPELLRGERGTPAADVFSLGAVLYELATGNPPFGTTLTDVVRNQGSVVLALPRPAPRDLRHVILGQLAIEEGRRLCAMEALANLTARADAASATARLGPLSQKLLSERCPMLVGELAVETHHHTPEVTAWEPERRRRSRHVAPALAAVAAVACVAGWFVFDARTADDGMTREFIVATAEEERRAPRRTPRYLETDVLPSQPRDTPVSPADRGEPVNTPDGPREKLREDEAEESDEQPVEPVADRASRRDDSRQAARRRSKECSDETANTASAVFCTLEQYDGRTVAYALQGNQWVVLYDAERRGDSVFLRVLTGGEFSPKRVKGFGGGETFSGEVLADGDGWIVRLPIASLIMDVILADDRDSAINLKGVRVP